MTGHRPARQRAAQRAAAGSGSRRRCSASRTPCTPARSPPRSPPGPPAAPPWCTAALALGGPALWNKGAGCHGSKVGTSLLARKKRQRNCVYVVACKCAFVSARACTRGFILQCNRRKIGLPSMCIVSSSVRARQSPCCIWGHVKFLWEKSTTA